MGGITLGHLILYSIVILITQTPQKDLLIAVTNCNFISHPLHVKVYLQRSFGDMSGTPVKNVSHVMCAKNAYAMEISPF